MPPTQAHGDVSEENKHMAPHFHPVRLTFHVALPMHGFIHHAVENGHPDQNHGRNPEEVAMRISQTKKDNTGDAEKNRDGMNKSFALIQPFLVASSMADG